MATDISSDYNVCKQMMKRSSGLITSTLFFRNHSAGYNLLLRKYSIAPVSFLLTSTSKKSYVQASQQIIFDTACFIEKRSR
jgi:hypothetical protein